jgi:hypothetical protein
MAPFFSPNYKNKGKRGKPDDYSALFGIIEHYSALFSIIRHYSALFGIIPLFFLGKISSIVLRVVNSTVLHSFQKRWVNN